MNNRWTDKLFGGEDKPKTSSQNSSTTNTNTSSTSTQVFDFFKPKDKALTALEKYRATVEPIKRRHAERKAGMPGYFQNEMNAHVSEELKQIKTEILHQIGDLREEIDDLSESCLALLYTRKIRIKCVKKYALGALLDAKTLDNMKAVAEREKKNPEVVAGFHSRTAALLNRIIYLENENQKRPTLKK